MRPSFLQKKPFVMLGALFCCALWGISTPIVKMGYTYIDATHIPSLLLWVGAQFVVAGVLTIGFSAVTAKKLLLPKKESLLGIGVTSLLQTVLQYALLYVGLAQTTSVKGAVLKSTDVFFVVLITGLLLKTEKLTAKKLISCAIGFGGILIMNLDGLSLRLNPLGDGLVLLAIVCYSFSVALTKRFTQNENPVLLCGCQMALGGAVLTVGGVLFGGTFDVVGMMPVFVGLSLLYAVSYTLWTVLLKHNPASSVTIFSFMTPVFGVVFSALLLSEDSGVAPLNLITALVLVCFGILLWGYERKRG